MEGWNYCMKKVEVGWEGCIITDSFIWTRGGRQGMESEY